MKPDWKWLGMRKMKLYVADWGKKEPNGGGSPNNYYCLGVYDDKGPNGQEYKWHDDNCNSKKKMAVCEMKAKNLPNDGNHDGYGNGDDGYGNGDDGHGHDDGY